MIPHNVFVIAGTAVGISEPGVYVNVSTSAVTATMPPRSPGVSTVRVKPRPNAYRIDVLPTGSVTTVNAWAGDNFVVNGATVATFTLTPGQSVEMYDNGANWVARIAPLGGASFRAVQTSNAVTLTLDRKATLWVFSGTTTTWTLPAIASTVGIEYLIKNRGSGAITLQRAGSDQLYDSAAVSSISITAGATARIVNDGTYWLVL